MNRLKKPKMHRTGYEVLKFPWPTVRNAMAQFDPDPQVLKQALKIGHGIEIVDMPGSAQMLYFCVPQFQIEKMRQFKIPETIMYLCGNCEFISDSEEDVVMRFKNAMTKEN